MQHLRISLALYLATIAPVTSAFAQSAFTQSVESEAPQAITLQAEPDYCINIMADFSSDDPEVRYQFFRLTQELGRDVTPEYRAALAAYGDGEVSADTHILDVIENIANPVLRQAAPGLTVSNMAYLADFAAICEPFITGQINSLEAYDAALTDVEFNAVIIEDALFLRQILSDSMYRLGANEDPAHGTATAEYAQALITTRDQAEFTSFEAELDGLEVLFMTDLDGRLKRSNDVINEEIDREVLGDSIALSDSINQREKDRAKEIQRRTLWRILRGGR